MQQVSKEAQCCLLHIHIVMIHVPIHFQTLNKPQVYTAAHTKATVKHVDCTREACPAAEALVRTCSVHALCLCSASLVNMWILNTVLLQKHVQDVWYLPLKLRLEHNFCTSCISCDISRLHTGLFEVCVIKVAKFTKMYMFYLECYKKSFHDAVL